MARNRLRIVLKILFLLGLPIAAVLGLFCCGVYTGYANREPITRFEKDWLGMDVKVHEQPKADAAPSEDEEPPRETPGSDSDASLESAASDATSEERGSDDSKWPEPRQRESDRPEPRRPEPAPEPAESPEPEQPPTRVDPVQSDLEQVLELPVTVRVKVLVDDALVASQPDWINYVQRTVAEGSHIYERQFGITLVLGGVGRWNVATVGMSAEALAEDLRSRPREGNDVLLGLTHRVLDGDKAGIAETPAEGSPFNGAYGLVYAMPGRTKPHLRGLLHEMSHVLGAVDVTDPSDPAWKQGSWMSYAAVRPGQAPWIDAENRRRILMRKDKPFRPEQE
jgi:hypothetical protein